jgi:hypothetical protein
VNDATQLIAFLSGGEVADPEWPKLVQAAGETLTIGLLADRALGGEWELPDAIHDLLTEVRDRARTRNARIRDQFAELLAVLNRVGVEPIPMKGLARLLGSRSSDSRLLSDIDILIPEDRRDECAAAIASLGYAGVEEGDERAPMVFSRSSDVGSVDLHSRVRPYYLRLSYEDLAPLCSEADTAAGRVRMPSPTCQALMLIAHDQLHDGDYWRGLVDVRHLLDLREIIGEGVDWAQLRAFFPPGSCRRALQAGLLSVRSLAGAEVPAAECGGAWARLQLSRSRVQSRFPALRPALTLLAIAADPPMAAGSGSPEHRPGETPRQRLGRRLASYLRPTNPGKISGSSSSPQRGADVHSAA